MENELIYSIRLDGADENIKTLIEQKRVLADLGKEKKRLQKEQIELEKQLDAQLKNGEITQEQYNEAVKLNIAQQVQVETNIKKVNEQKRISEKITLANATATGEGTKSMQQMSAQLSAMQLRFKNMSIAERESAKGKELQQHINELNEEYKDLHVSIGNTQVMVGSYQNAVNSLLPVMGGIGGKIQGVIGQLNQIKTALSGAGTAMKGYAVATNGSVNSLKLFRIALISTGVGAIVVALGSLIGAFLSTQRGIDAVNKVLTPLKEVFATLVGFLQTKALAIFDQLKKAIDNPKQAFQDLLDFVKTNVTNRFNGLIQFFKGWAGVFVNSWKVLGLNIKKATNDIPFIGAGLGKDALKKLDEDIEKAKDSVKKGAKDMADGFIAVNTGIANGTDKLAKMYDDVAKSTKKGLDRGDEIERLTVAIRKSEQSYKLDMAKNNLLAEKMKFILEDETKSMEERNKAGKEYLRLIESSGKREIDLMNMKVKLMKLQEQANDTSDEQIQERMDLEAESLEKLAGLTGRQIEVRNKLNSMEKEAITKLEEQKKKALEEEKKQASELAKFKDEVSKKSVEKQIANLQIEQEKEKVLFAGTKAEEFEMERKHKEDLYKLTLELAQKEKDINIKTLQEQIEIEKALKKDTKILELKLEEEKNNSFLELKQDYQLALLDIDQKQSEYNKENTKKALEDEKKLKETLRDERVKASEDLTKSLFENEKNRIERTTKREIEALTLRRQAGEISAEEFEKKRLEIDKKAFEKKKKLDTREVILNGIVAISKIFTQRAGVLGIPEAIAMAAQTATQVAQIQAQKFRFGGNVGGKSHSQGGTMIEAERGEAIIMKEAVNPVTAPILSAINTAYGGAPIEALNSFRGGGVSAPMMQSQTIEVVNVATDTNKIANRVKNLQNSRRF